MRSAPWCWIAVLLLGCPTGVADDDAGDDDGADDDVGDDDSAGDDDSGDDDGADDDAGDDDTAAVAYVGSALWEVPRDVAVAGDHALCSFYYGLQVLDFTVPSQPEVVARVPLDGDGAGVDLAGDRLVVAHQRAVTIFDASDPAAPLRLGHFETPGTAHAVDVVGDHAFVADGYTSGLVVFDIADPAQPHQVGAVALNGDPHDVVVDGDHAYLACYEAGLQVVDVADPAAPAVVGALDTELRALAVTVDGGYAHVSEQAGTWLVVDVSDPAQPVQVHGEAIGVGEVAVGAGHAFVTRDRALEIYDLSTPAAPVQVATLPLPGDALGVTYAAGEAWIEDHRYGVHRVDVSNPVQPQLLGTHDAFQASYDLAREGDHLFVADAALGATGEECHAALRVVDITDPTWPVRVGTASMPGSAGSPAVAVAGDHAFLTDFTHGLRCFDVSDPANPTLAGQLGSFELAYELAVAGDVAYVVDRYTGVVLLDVSDPAAPTPLGTWTATLPNTDAVAVAGTTAYVLTDDFAAVDLVVLDVSVPAQPVEIGRHSGLGDAPSHQELLVDGTTLYVANDTGGLHVFDVSDPTAPVRLGGSDAWLGPYEAIDYLALQGTTLLATSYEGLVVIDVSDPADPLLVARHTTAGAPRGVATDGTNVWIADGLATVGLTLAP